MIVSGDSTRLRQVIDNLLANVRTHTPAGTPRPRVRLGIEGSRAVLEVADEGPGLPSQERGADLRALLSLRSLAQPRQRRRRPGLAIVDAIVVAHGGNPEALDNTPTGALFRARFPLGVAGEEAPLAADPAQESLTSL